MDCPHCRTEIDKHEPSRCLRGWVAKDVMGWRVENGKDGLPAHAFPDEGGHVYLLPDLGPQWYPDHDIAAAWEVHEAQIEKPFSRRREYLLALEEELREREKYIIAWPDALIYLSPLTICRAALKATIKEFA